MSVPPPHLSLRRLLYWLLARWALATIQNCPAQPRFQIDKQAVQALRAAAERMLAQHAAPPTMPLSGSKNYITASGLSNMMWAFSRFKVSVKPWEHLVTRYGCRATPGFCAGHVSWGFILHPFSFPLLPSSPLSSCFQYATPRKSQPKTRL